MDIQVTFLTSYTEDELSFCGLHSKQMLCLEIRWDKQQNSYLYLRRDYAAIILANFVWHCRQVILIGVHGSMPATLGMGNGDEVTMGNDDVAWGWGMG